MIFFNSLKTAKWIKVIFRQFEIGWKCCTILIHFENGNKTWLIHFQYNKKRNFIKVAAGKFENGSKYESLWSTLRMMIETQWYRLFHKAVISNKNGNGSKWLLANLKVDQNSARFWAKNSSTKPERHFCCHLYELLKL